MSTIEGGPPSPVGRSGVVGLLIKSSRSPTLGLRTSIEGRRFYIVLQNQTNEGNLEKQQNNVRKNENRKLF